MKLDEIQNSVISKDKILKIEKFLNFLIEKNNELNLVSRKLDINTIIKEHIYDCTDAFPYFEKYQTIVDLGSGGGFPGILLGIVFENKKINLIEKSYKKSQFLLDAKKYLELSNIFVNNTLVESYNGECDVITCRAFKSIIEILDMTKKYFNRGIDYLLYKARMETINEEIKEAEKKYKFKYEIKKIAEKIEDKERHLVILKKA